MELVIYKVLVIASVILTLYTEIPVSCEPVATTPSLSVGETQSCDGVCLSKQMRLTSIVGAP